MDRLLCRFGLPGQAFVPLLSSHACALPGILSTRLIPDRHDRLATILVAPFHELLGAAAGLRAGHRHPLRRPAAVGRGWRSPAATCWAARWRWAAPSSSAAPCSRAARGRWCSSCRPTRCRRCAPPFATAFHQGKTFLEKAGTVILAICVVMWWLSAYPKTAPPAAAVQLAAQAAEVRAADSAGERPRWRGEAVTSTAKNAQGASFAGRLGRAGRAGFCAARLRLAADRRGAHQLPRPRSFRFHHDRAAGGATPTPRPRGVMAQVQQAKRDDGTPLFTTGHLGQPAGILRSGDAVPAHPGAHPARRPAA